MAPSVMKLAIFTLVVIIVLQMWVPHDTLTLGSHSARQVLNVDHNNQAYQQEMMSRMISDLVDEQKRLWSAIEKLQSVSGNAPQTNIFNKKVGSMDFFSAAEVDQFNKDGFVISRGLFNAAEMVLVMQYLEEVQSAPLERGKSMVYLENNPFHPGQRMLSRIEKFTDYHDGFRQLGSSDRILRRLSQLFGAEPLLFKEKVNFKLPGGDKFDAHQDIQPGWDDYAPDFITAFVTMDPNTLENGCLQLAKGFHRRGQLGPRMVPLNETTLTEMGLQFEAYPTQPGDVVFFTSFTPHKSSPNRSKFARRNLFFTYNSAKFGDHRQKYYDDKRKAFPPDNEREPGKVYSYKV